MPKHIRKKEWLFPLISGVAAGLIFILGSFVIRQISTDNSHQGYADILEPVIPFTVSIYSNRTIDRSNSNLPLDPLLSRYVDKSIEQRSSLGSGIIYNTDGHVVTNAHVIQSADQIIVVSHTGAQATVSQVLIDPETDIAVLKTNLSINTSPPLSSKQERVGDIAFSIGNPFGIGQSVSMGVISATSRIQPGITTLTDFIQTDASINPGNSGGALVNSNGEIIGMNTAIFSSSGGSQGIGFAIPFGDVQTVANALIEHGPITRGYLGIDVKEIDLTSETGSHRQRSGLEVTSVAADGPAVLAGLVQGDVLLTMNQIPLTSRTQAARLIANLMPGKNTEITVLREGNIIELQATLAHREQ